MNAEYTVNLPDRLVKITVVGGFTTAEILAFLARVTSDPTVEAGFGILSDHRGVTTPVSPEQVRDTVNFLERQSNMRGACWAVVTGSRASYGMMRMLSAYAEGFLRVGIFETIEEARTWIDLTRSTP